MTDNRLYTVILDYKGGTYIAQVSARSPAAALPKWLSNLKNADLAKWGIARDELAKIINSSESVVPLDACLNVWCTSGLAKRGLALVHIVATDGSPDSGEGQVEHS